MRLCCLVLRNTSRNQWLSASSHQARSKHTIGCKIKRSATPLVHNHQHAVGCSWVMCVCCVCVITCVCVHACACVCVRPRPKATRPAATITVTDVKELGRLRKRSAPGTTRPARALNQYSARARARRITHAQGCMWRTWKLKGLRLEKQKIKNLRPCRRDAGARGQLQNRVDTHSICTFLHVNLINQSPDDSPSPCACPSPTR